MNLLVAAFHSPTTQYTVENNRAVRPGSTSPGAGSFAGFSMFDPTGSAVVVSELQLTGIPDFVAEFTMSVTLFFRQTNIFCECLAAAPKHFLISK